METTYGEQTIVLPVQYPLILLSVALLCFECWFIGMFISNYARHTTFTKEFMAQFNDMHREATGKDQTGDSGGFPDCGDGRYAEKLGYAEWHRYCSFFRAHNNFVEQLPVIVTILVFSGLFLPKTTMWIGFINVISRGVYTFSYIYKGPNWRFVGALANLCTYLLVIVALGFAVAKAF